MGFPRRLAYVHLPSPLGLLLLAGNGAALHLVGFPNGSRTVRPPDGWTRDAAPLRQAIAQVDAYFAGETDGFEIALALNETDFQNAVWTALGEILHGETVSYSGIARRIGRPTAVRAVGATNGANPLPLIVPCHRVVGANGSLTGFGGGLDAKRFLLDHEEAMNPPGGTLPPCRTSEVCSTPYRPGRREARLPSGSRSTWRHAP